MDANFGLVRKKASGVSSAPPKRQFYFLDQKIIDEKIGNTIEMQGKELVIYYLLYSSIQIHCVRNPSGMGRVNRCPLNILLLASPVTFVMEFSC